MTRSLTLVGIALAAIACDSAATAPRATMDVAAGVAALADALAPDSLQQRRPPRPDVLEALSRAPAALQPTDAQKSAITSARTAFESANAADLAALDAVRLKADSARRAGASRDQVRTILESGRAIAERLRPAMEGLRKTVDGILTAEQKAWLEANRPPRGPGGPGGPGGRP